MPADRKRQIAEEFMRLAKIRPVDKITVKDLVTACHITRQTFYYHFQDLMDVLEWCLEQSMERLAEKSLEMPERGQAMKLFVETAVEGREMIRKLLSSSQREQTERLIVKATRTYLQEIIDRKELCQNVSRADMEVALNFYAFAIVGTLLEACEKPRVNAELLAGQLTRLLDGTMMQEDKL